MNPQRGEVALQLEDRVLALAPSFALIAELEDRLGPLPALLRRLAGEDWAAGELAELLAIALAHAPGAPAPERREGLLLAAGLAQLRPSAIELLINALSGAQPLLQEAGEEAPGKPPPPARRIPGSACQEGGVSTGSG